ncbi:hypothetical protein BC830DRAFT_179331 [Chytriomyces sp. MP71]|nr:hypothetical protein BC830DRAFT_179331 [Chytriomyces sp. MP71]
MVKYSRILLATVMLVLMATTKTRGITMYFPSIATPVICVCDISGLLGGFMIVSFDLFCLACFCRLMFKTRHDNTIDPYFLTVALYGVISSICGVLRFAAVHTAPLHMIIPTVLELVALTSS